MLSRAIKWGLTLIGRQVRGLTKVILRHRFSVNSKDSQLVGSDLRKTSYNKSHSSFQHGPSRKSSWWWTPTIKDSVRWEPLTNHATMMAPKKWTPSSSNQATESPDRVKYTTTLDRQRRISYSHSREKIRAHLVSSWEAAMQARAIATTTQLRTRLSIRLWMKSESKTRNWIRDWCRTRTVSTKTPRGILAARCTKAITLPHKR